MPYFSHDFIQGRGKHAHPASSGLQLASAGKLVSGCYATDATERLFFYLFFSLFPEYKLF